jgi:glutamate formiminotransferase
LKKIIECVPNFSEGRDLSIIDAIAESIRKVEGVQLLHVDPGYDANRTVMTFIGEPEALIEAAFQAIKTASERIDMRMQKGTHPRIGATDVCPIIPIQGVTMSEAIVYAEKLAKRVGEEILLPVYLYEESAKSIDRKNLANIRLGEYEGLMAKMSQSNWVPDYGPTDFNAKSGATVIGARNFLLAYNINLNTNDVGIAKNIAKNIRSSNLKSKYALQNLKAIGWYIEEYKCAQISMNLTNYHLTNMHHVYEICKREAKNYGTELNGSELIGLLPIGALLESGKYFEPKTVDEKDIIQAAIHHLGLSSIKTFDPDQRVIEYLIGSQHLT